MNKTLINILIFAAGAAIGSAVTWKVTKDMYARIAQEEIDSVKEAFSDGLRTSHSHDSEDAPAFETVTNQTDDVEEYKEIIEDLNYNNNEEPGERGDEAVMDDRPIIITPDEFGEIYEYSTVSLTYYADGIVTDDQDAVLDDDEVEELIGLDSLEHFGEYEDDSVFVRNHSTRTDYEILKDLRNYYEEG